MSWSVGELAEQCAGRLRGPADARVDSFSVDTRTLAPGALFVAIRGERFDGNDFVAEALRAGAAAALVDREPGPSVSGPTITVDDSVEALGRLAASHRARFRGPVVAITGSNGKTTTKEMCASILSAAGARARKSAGNLNNHLGLPLSVLTLRDADEALVVELGMSHAGEIEKLARIAEPTVGAITNIAAAHLGPLGSIEAIARAKGELFERIRPDGVAVINADDARCAARDDSERVGVRDPASDPVDKRGGAVGFDDPSGLHRQCNRVRMFRHDADDLGFQPKQITNRNQSADPGAHADRHVNRIETFNRGKQLEGIGCDAANDVLVKRRH